MQGYMSAAASRVASVTIAIHPRPDAADAFSSWQAKVALSAAGFRGFINAEVIAPTAASPGSSAAWRSVVRFDRVENVRAWRNSEEYRALLAQAQSLVNSNDSEGFFEEESDEDAAGTVCEVVTTHVKPGKEREYEEWAAGIHRAEAIFPGYRGWLLQPPTSKKGRYWTTFVRFATAEQLESWLNSDVRHRLLSDHAALVDSWEHHRLPSSFAGWFPQGGAGGEAPAVWKQSMLVLLVLFPIVVLELRFLRPLLGALNSASATFIGNAISVGLLAWPLMPLVIGAMNWWLSPRKDARRSIDLAGAALVIALYVLEITVFFRFA
jgi:uncharacterized protein